MQLSEVRVDGDWSFHLSLHPLVTVVTGLGPARRPHLAEVIARGLQGDGLPGCALFWGEDSLEVNADRLAGLGIPASIDVRVSAADLPGAKIISATVPETSDDGAGTGEAEETDEPEVASEEDRIEVEQALAAVESAREDVHFPTEDAADLIERWADLERRWEQAHVDEGGSERIDGLRRRLEAARFQLAAAEQYAKPLQVEPEMHNQLDEAHRLVLELEERVQRRLAGGGARRRLDAARAVEQGLLQRVGLTSYDAFQLRTSAGLGDLDATDRLRVARAELLEAEAAWELASLNDPPAVRALRRERESVIRTASALAGRELSAAEVADALEKQPPREADHDALVRLQRALDRVGVIVHRTLDEEARRWLEGGALIPRSPGHRSPAGVSGPVEVDVSNVDPEEAEVYLLARIASQRMVGEAGSLPLVLDEPFAGLPDRVRQAMLGLLQRLAPAIQVVYLSDDPAVIRWGTQLPREMGAVRHFGPS